MLYSRYPAQPATLPTRIRLSDGTTRTDLDSWSNEDLAAIGYYPVTEVKPQLGQNQIYGTPTLELDGSIVIATYPIETAPPPAITVSPWQIRKALNILNLRETVESAVASADQDAKDGWNHALSFDRYHPLVISMAANLNLTESDVTDLFLLASQQ